MVPSSKTVTKGLKGNVSLLLWYLDCSKQFLVACKTLWEDKVHVKTHVY